MIDGPDMFLTRHASIFQQRQPYRGIAAHSLHQEPEHMVSHVEAGICRVHASLTRGA